VGSIQGDIWPGALLHTIQLPNHMSIMEVAVMWQSALMRIQEFAHSCRCDLPLEDAVNELGLHQMNIPLTVPPDVNSNQQNIGLGWLHWVTPISNAFKHNVLLCACPCWLGQALTIGMW